MAQGAFIAVDWGTTNRRAMLVDGDGIVLDTMADGAGVLSVASGTYTAEIAHIRERLGGHPVLAAGMVGSNRGWLEAPYVDAPCALEDLAASLVEAAPDIRIVPGVALRGKRADVMRGEEVQALGCVAAGLCRTDALMCQPGTHNKWINLRDGRLVDFATAMTGEIFALLKNHGVMAGMLEGTVSDGDAFRGGVARGISANDLSVALFSVRAAVLLDRLAEADAAAYASGILIGADVGARQDVTGREVTVLGTGLLASLYGVAIESAGGIPLVVDCNAAFAAGMYRLWEAAR